MASRSQDDGFREIQLNGKQLVFMFMAVTVVSVVIFLCGVLVGRGVRGERAASVSASQTEADQLKLDFAVAQRPPTVVQPGDDPTKASPPPAIDGEAGKDSGKEAQRPDAAEAVPKTAGTAQVRMPASSPADKPDPNAAPRADARTTAVPDMPRAAATTPMPADAAATAKPAAPPPAPAAKALADESIPTPDDAKQGWVVQVAAVKTRAEADAMARRLNTKGYSVFVLSSNPNVFRVRVGGYKSKRDAETVAARLRKEERINPWVTR